jgi:membrane protein DedA with SNARE-associated domain
MHQTDAIHHLLATAGAPGVFVVCFIAALGIGAPIPITALLLTLGALSGSAGAPNLPPLAFAGVLGAVGGHLVDYWVGRMSSQIGSRLGGRLEENAGARWLSRALSRASGDTRLRALLRPRGGAALVIFLSRFLLTPIASPISLLAGMMRQRFGLYLALEVAGEVIYVLGNLALGRAFGARLLAGGGAKLLLFWLGVTVLTLLPLALMRLASRLGLVSPAPRSEVEAA